jgi:hypothetical protein
LANIPEIQQWAEDMGLLVKVLDFGKTPKLESANLLRKSTILFGLHGKFLIFLLLMLKR